MTENYAEMGVITDDSDVAICRIGLLVEEKEAGSPDTVVCLPVSHVGAVTNQDRAAMQTRNVFGQENDTLMARQLRNLACNIAVRYDFDIKKINYRGEQKRNASVLFHRDVMKSSFPPFLLRAGEVPFLQASSDDARSGEPDLTPRRQASRVITSDCVNGLVRSLMRVVDQEVADEVVSQISAKATPNGWLYLDVAVALIIASNPRRHLMIPSRLQKAITEVLHKTKEQSILFPAL